MNHTRIPFSLFQTVALGVLCLCAILFSPRAVEAAKLSLDGPDAARAGREMIVEILLDPEGENINSVDITVTFSPEELSFSGYSAQRGSIPFWVMTPREVRPGEVRLSGVIPGGLDRGYDPGRPSAATLPLAALLFTPKGEGAASIAISDAMLLRNDGKGSEVAAVMGSTSVPVRTGGVAGEESSDTLAPERFTITIIERSHFGKTPRLAIFEASDNESGVARYEVSIGGKKFVEASSPYGVPRRIFPATMTVRAFDFAGNYTEATTVIEGDVPLIIVVIACVLVLAIVIYIVRARKRKKLL